MDAKPERYTKEYEMQFIKEHYGKKGSVGKFGPKELATELGCSTSYVWRRIQILISTGELNPIQPRIKKIYNNVFKKPQNQAENCTDIDNGFNDNKKNIIKFIPTNNPQIADKKENWERFRSYLTEDTLRALNELHEREHIPIRKIVEKAVGDYISAHNPRHKPSLSD